MSCGKNDVNRHPSVAQIRSSTNMQKWTEHGCMDLVAHSEQHTSKPINIQIPCSRPADDWDCFQKAGYVDATRSLKTSHVVCDGEVFRKDQLAPSIPTLPSQSPPQNSPPGCSTLHHERLAGVYRESYQYKSFPHLSLAARRSCVGLVACHLRVPASDQARCSPFTIASMWYHIAIKLPNSLERLVTLCPQ